MHFTQPQINQIIEDVVNHKDGLNTIFKMTLGALIKPDRIEHDQHARHLSNGHSSRRIFGNHQMLELQELPWS